MDVSDGGGAPHGKRKQVKNGQHSKYKADGVRIAIRTTPDVCFGQSPGALHIKVIHIYSHGQPLSM